jgi:hypothetical protein
VSDDQREAPARSVVGRRPSTSRKPGAPPRWRNRANATSRAPHPTDVSGSARRAPRCTQRSPGHRAPSPAAFVHLARSAGERSRDGPLVATVSALACGGTPSVERARHRAPTTELLRTTHRAPHVAHVPATSQPLQRVRGHRKACEVRRSHRHDRTGCDSHERAPRPRPPAPRDPRQGPKTDTLMPGRAGITHRTENNPEMRNAPDSTVRGTSHEVECRRRPTLPHPGECSTIGAGRLSYRVRNGTGRFPTAMTTDNTIQLSPHPPENPKRRGSSTQTNPTIPGSPGTWMVVDSGSHSGCEQLVVASPRPISTGQLHPSQGFHLRPINPVIYWEPYPLEGGGRPHLGTGFPLRCLQRLSLPNIANQPCPWRDNWHTRGSSVPVLSY